MTDDDRKSTLKIQNGKGAKCIYCGATIGSHEKEVTTITFPYKHYHLVSYSGDCEGWIYHNWKFITNLLWQLADIGGDDYKDTISMLIKMWEEGDC